MLLTKLSNYIIIKILNYYFQFNERNEARYSYHLDVMISMVNKIRLVCQEWSNTLISRIRIPLIHIESKRDLEKCVRFLLAKGVQGTKLDVLNFKFSLDGNELVEISDHCHSITMYNNIDPKTLDNVKKFKFPDIESFHALSTEFKRFNFSLKSLVVCPKSSEGMENAVSAILDSNSRSLKSMHIDSHVYIIYNLVPLSVLPNLTKLKLSQFIFKERCLVTLIQELKLTKLHLNNVLLIDRAYDDQNVGELYKALGENQTLKTLKWTVEEYEEEGNKPNDQTTLPRVTKFFSCLAHFLNRNRSVTYLKIKDEAIAYLPKNLHTTFPLDRYPIHNDTIKRISVICDDYYPSHLYIEQYWRSRSSIEQIHNIQFSDLESIRVHHQNLRHFKQNLSNGDLLSVHILNNHIYNIISLDVSLRYSLVGEFFQAINQSNTIESLTVVIIFPQGITPKTMSSELYHLIKENHPSITKYLVKDAGLCSTEWDPIEFLELLSRNQTLLGVTIFSIIDRKSQLYKLSDLIRSLISLLSNNKTLKQLCIPAVPLEHDHLPLDLIESLTTAIKSNSTIKDITFPLTVDHNQLYKIFKDHLIITNICST